MDDIAIWDFAFGVVTTLALGLLTVVQFVTDRKRRRFEDIQIALDIQASLTSREILDVIRQPELSESDRAFLTHAHGVALDRQDAMDAFTKLKPSIRAAVEASLARVYAVVQADPLVRARQEVADAVYRTTVVDRSKYTWADSGEKLGKWDVLALAGARWLREHPELTTRAEFEKTFGNVVRPVIEPLVPGAKFDSKLLLQPVVFAGQREVYARRGQKWLAAHSHDGVIQLDGHSWRVGWDLGFAGKGGGSTHLALIDYFRSSHGYDIRPAT